MEKELMNNLKGVIVRRVDREIIGLEKMAVTRVNFEKIGNVLVLFSEEQTKKILPIAENHEKLGEGLPFIFSGYLYNAQYGMGEETKFQQFIVENFMKI